jgi:hypothetical protein
MQPARDRPRPTHAIDMLEAQVEERRRAEARKKVMGCARARAYVSV